MHHQRIIRKVWEESLYHRESTSVLNFQMLAHSATLNHEWPTSNLKQAAMDTWDNIYFGLLYLFQESMVFSQTVSFSINFTKLRNYSLCESLINSFEVRKSEKSTTTKYMNKSLKKHHRYIYCVLGWLGKIPSPRPPRSPKVTVNLKCYLLNYLV